MRRKKTLGEHAKIELEQMMRLELRTRRCESVLKFVDARSTSDPSHLYIAISPPVTWTRPHPDAAASVSCGHRGSLWTKLVTDGPVEMYFPTIAALDLPPTSTSSRS